ncbi:MAG: hypothetical protein JXQ73_14265 [Phycisphaerae bacterium]|nr:hypothetical protein [Phycisphaerae bacterium]
MAKNTAATASAPPAVARIQGEWVMTKRDPMGLKRAAVFTWEPFRANTRYADAPPSFTHIACLTGEASFVRVPGAEGTCRNGQRTLYSAIVSVPQKLSRITPR